MTDYRETGDKPAIEPDVRAYLDQIVGALEEWLGAGLVGVYVHGSLAMGAFTPGRSDIDVLAVCGEPLTSKRSVALGAALDAIPRTQSGGDLEFSLVTEAEARSPSAKPAFEVHVSTHEEHSVVNGHDHPGDEDLVVHFAMTRARGLALLGPDPKDLFREPNRLLLMRGFLSDIEWAGEHGAAVWEGHEMPELASMAYRVLNAARSWRYLETGDLGSRLEGAMWLKLRTPNKEVHALVDAALALQCGEAPDHPDRSMVDVFVDRVATMLRREMGSQ